MPQLSLQLGHGSLDSHVPQTTHGIAQQLHWPDRSGSVLNYFHVSACEQGCIGRSLENAIVSQFPFFLNNNKILQTSILCGVLSRCPLFRFTCMTLLRSLPTFPRKIFTNFAIVWETGTSLSYGFSTFLIISAWGKDAMSSGNFLLTCSAVQYFHMRVDSLFFKYRIVREKCYENLCITLFSFGSNSENI